MQTDFAKSVGVAHGLQRGLEGSRAAHERVEAGLPISAIQRPL